MNRRTGPFLRWLLLAAILCGDAAVAGACCLAGPSETACCPADEHRANAYVHRCEADAPRDCAGCRAYSGDRAAGGGNARLHGAHPGPALRPDVLRTRPADGPSGRTSLSGAAVLASSPPGPPVSRGPPPA